MPRAMMWRSALVEKRVRPFLHARSNRLDLPYRHWLTGYLTAVNTLTKDTVAIRGTTDIDGILWLLD